jgi:hypothetical protein
MAADELQHPLISDAHHIAISKIIINWALLDRGVMELLWQTATGHSFENFTPQAALSLSLVVGMDIRVKLGLLRAVFHARRPADADKFDKIISKIDRLGKRRNLIAHGVWRLGNRPGSIECASFSAAGGRLKSEQHSFTVIELNGLAMGILDVGRELVHAFVAAFGRPSPEILQRPTP